MKYTKPVLIKHSNKNQELYYLVVFLYCRNGNVYPPSFSDLVWLILSRSLWIVGLLHSSLVSKHLTVQKIKFSIKDFFSKCDQILNGKLHSLCNDLTGNRISPLWHFYVICIVILYFLKKNGLW